MVVVAVNVALLLHLVAVVVTAAVVAATLAYIKQCRRIQSSIKYLLHACSHARVCVFVCGACARMRSFNATLASPLPLSWLSWLRL